MQAIETQDKQFHDGNGTTELGTILPAWWLNQIQAEILAVLTAAKVTPNKTKTNQLLESLNKIVVGGVVDSLTSTATDKALSAAQGKELAERVANAVSGSFAWRGKLTTQNLNNLVGVTNYGVWQNEANVNATVERNYPTTKAGTLFMLPSAYQGVQLYVPFDQSVLYLRHSVSTTAGTWSAWRIIGEVVNALNSTSTTAAVSAAMGKKLNDEKLGNSGTQTLNGNLYINRPTAWEKIRFTTQSGFWRFEANPVGDAATGGMRINYVFTGADNTEKSRIAFPESVGTSTVAYQSWVNSQLTAKTKFARPIVLSGSTAVELNLTSKASILKFLGNDYIGSGYHQIVLHNTSANHVITGLPLTTKAAIQLDICLMGGYSYIECHYLAAKRTFRTPINWNVEKQTLAWQENLNQNNGVMLTGNQTIAGTKTFSGSLETQYRLVIRRSGGATYNPYIFLIDDNTNIANTIAAEKWVGEIYMRAGETGQADGRTKSGWRTRILADKNVYSEWCTWDAANVQKIHLRAFSKTGNVVINGSADNGADKLQINGSLSVIGGGKTARLGTGAGDVYFANLKSNKYLQLKDDGTLAYSNDVIALAKNVVKQGSGVGQNTGHDIKIGWNGSRLKATVDATDLGNIVFDSQLNNAVSQAVPSGVVAYFAGANAPSGWLKCNGAAVSRSVYAGIFAAIGTHYGAGNGSTTFNLPDLRGEFVRSWDDGRGVDGSRVLGSWQHDQFQAARERYAQGSTVNTHAATPHATGSGGGVVRNISDQIPTDGVLYDAVGNFGTPRYGAETRPRNIALLACIKI